MKNKLSIIMKVFAIYCILLLSSLPSNAGTRDLIFEDDSALAAAKEAKNQNKPDAQILAIKTTIELTRDGKTSNVLPSFEFKSGDKVRFLYTPNIDGYVYWLSEGSSGKYGMLFPNKKSGMNNAVKKNEESTIPSVGSFKFDQTPGKEKILVVLSPFKVKELEDAVQEASKGNDEITTAAPKVSAVAENNSSKQKSRDLVFEEEENKETSISTKSQASTQKEEPFVSYYELIHN